MTDTDTLRAALGAAADAMDLVRDGLAVRSPDAVVINATSVLRHAAREARAALATQPAGPTRVPLNGYGYVKGRKVRVLLFEADHD